MSRPKHWPTVLFRARRSLLLKHLAFGQQLVGHRVKAKASHGRCADDPSIGRDPCHQAFGPFEAEDVVLVRTRVA
jgi:hypothetical protein